MSSYNIQHARHCAVAVTHQFHRGWLRRHLWKFAFATGRGRKTGQVEEFKRALEVAFCQRLAEEADQ